MSFPGSIFRIARRLITKDGDRTAGFTLPGLGSNAVSLSIFSLTGAVALSAGGLASAAERTAATVENTVTVGIYPSPPKVFWNQAGEPDGFFPELIEYIAQQEGWTLEPVACDWPDCLEAVERGDLDLMVDVSYSQKRDARFDFNREVVFPSWSVVFARSGSGIESVLDLHEKRIAVLEDGIQYEALQLTSEEFHIKPVFVQSPDYAEMFQMLERGEIDGVVVNRFFPAHQQFSNVVNTNILIKPAQVHFAAPEGDPDGLLSAIDRHLAEMKNEPDSLYYQAGERWLEGLDIHKTDWRLIGQLAVASGSIVLFGFIGTLAVGNRRLRREVTDRMAAQDQLHHKALHDSLTDLPNREFLLQRLGQRLSPGAAVCDQDGALLFLDLDRFKVVNDSLGHCIGDQLLIEMARRLKQTGYWVARLGGDEFVIYLDQVTGPQQVTEAANTILATLQTPCMLCDHEVVVSGSLGIVTGMQNYQTPSALLRDADIAMYRSKSKGRNRYTIFTQTMGDAAAKQLALEHDLRRAIAEHELILHYQPILSLESSRLVGFEALVRWQHPIFGMVSPADFIPMAEETGLIIPLGSWVLETACRQLKDWQRTSPENRHLMINVNVSVAQLKQSNFLEQLDDVLKTTGLSGENLILEITESLLIEDLAKTSQLLQQLRESLHWRQHR
jgi:diguanylate cyclase (GGDEF)-like protein